MAAGSIRLCSKFTEKETSVKTPLGMKTSSLNNHMQHHASSTTLFVATLKGHSLRHFSRTRLRDLNSGPSYPICQSVNPGFQAG